LAYVSSSEIFVLSAQQMKLLKILPEEYYGQAFGVLKISDDILFQSVLNGSDFTNVCTRKWKIIQRKMNTHSTLNIDYKYTKGISNETSVIQIKQQETPNTRLNVATIKKRWNKLMGNMWAQNAFFSPILIPTSDDSGIFIYFSGAGSIEKNMCERNHINYINISTFQEVKNVPKFVSEYYLVFEYSYNEFCCPYDFSLPDVIYCLFKDQTTIRAHGSLYDYASALILNNDNRFFYLIHSGCHCYNTEVSAYSFYVELLQQNMYMKLEQNIDLRW
jgi:hypothetical protein